MIGSYLDWLFATVVVVVAGLFTVVTVRHNLRIWRMRRAYKTLPDEVKEQVLRLVQEAAMEHPSVTFLRLNKEAQYNDELLRSHIGGRPYAEAGDIQLTDSPVKFLLQVRLDEPSLGKHWQGRLLTVFLAKDLEQVVRSYAAPSLDKYVALSAPVASLSCIPLTSIRMPVEGNEERLPPSPTRLCEMVPAIPQVLGRFTSDHSGLLSQILRPNVYGYDLETSDIAYVGGDPLLIQNPHEAVCQECGKPMRFLFQFGEIIPGLRLADAGVCYVYGCDDHPHHCRGFIDSH
jgi:hypothetical protein